MKQQTGTIINVLTDVDDIDHDGGAPCDDVDDDDACCYDDGDDDDYEYAVDDDEADDDGDVYMML